MKNDLQLFVKAFQYIVKKNKNSNTALTYWSLCARLVQASMFRKRARQVQSVGTLTRRIHTSGTISTNELDLRVCASKMREGFTRLC